MVVATLTTTGKTSCKLEWVIDPGAEDIATQWRAALDAERYLESLPHTTDSVELTANG